MKLSGALVLFLAVGIVAGRKDDQDSTSSLSSSGDSLDDASGMSEIRGAGASASGSSSSGSSSLGSSLGSGIGGSDLASGSYGGVGSSGLGGVGSGGMGSLGSGGMGGYGGLGSGGMGGLGSGSYGGLGSGGMGGLGSGSYGGLGSGGMGGLGSGSYGGLGSGGMGGLGSGSYGGLGSGDLDGVGAGGLNVYKLKHLLRLRALSGLDESDYYGSGLGGRGLGGRGGLDDGLGVDGGYMSGSRGYHSGYNGEEDRVGYESSGLGGGMGKYGSGYGGGVGHGLGHGLGHVGNMGGAYRHKLNRGRGLGHSLRALEAALASGTLEGSGLRGIRGYGGDLDEGYGGIGYGSYGGARLGHGLRGKYREGLGEGYGSGNLATGDMAYYNGDAYGVEDRYGGGKRLYKGKRNGYVKLPMHAAKGRAGSGSEAFQDFVAFNAWRGDGLKGNGGIDLSTVQAFFTDPVELGVDETSHGTNQKYKNYMQDKITDNLFKKTDRLMRQMKFIDSHLSHHTKDADNNSLIFSILSYTFLEFLKSYNVGGRNSTQAYEEAYDDAIKATIDKKSYEAYQFAAPVRRVQDIFQAIIGRQVQTVQEHCTLDTPDDWCNLYALMKTHQDSADCKPVWKHLKVFEKSLDTVFCPGDGLIREVKSKLSRTNKNDIFDTTISVIRLQSSNLKKQLLRLADLYKDIVDGQQNARLKCVRLADFDD